MVRQNKGRATTPPTFEKLHWLAAGLFLAAGAEALLARQRGKRDIPAALGWAPVIAAPAAGAAHAARALRPGPGTRTAASVLSGVAVGVGAAGLLAGIYASRRDQQDRPAWSRPRRLLDNAAAVAPLTFGATGILGLLLDHEEQAEAQVRERLSRSASIAGRLMPRRKPKLDRIVLHI